MGKPLKKKVANRQRVKLKKQQTFKWKIQNYPKQDVVKGKNPL